MLRVYKSGRVELLEDQYSIQDTQPSIRRDPAMPNAAEGDMVLEIPSDKPILLNPAEVEQIFTCAKAEAQKTIDAANEQAKQLLDEAQRQVQAIQNSAAEQGRAQGRVLGYAEGAASKVASIEQCITMLEDWVASAEGELGGFMAQYESDLKWAVLEVCSKVLGRVIDRDELEMLDLVKETVDRARGAEWMDLHLSEQSVALIDRVGRELGPIRQLEIHGDDIPPGSCILDMPNGKLDASIDTQLQNLREYFASHNTNF
ncbi:MAG: FliH/SctL family protein [Angelakisella sp.]